MEGTKEFKGDYAVKCDYCKYIVPVDRKYIEYYENGGEMPHEGLCPNCRKGILLTRKDVGVTILPLYRGKIDFHWEE